MNTDTYTCTQINTFAPYLTQQLYFQKGLLLNFKEKVVFFLNSL